MTTRHLSRASAAFVGALCLAGGSAAAQGTLSTQGFGYPTGQLSTRALGTGGSIGEFDPASPINPAALGSWGASPISSGVRRALGRVAFTAQYDPEFRRVSAAGGAKSGLIPRFPLIAVTVPLRDRLQIGASASTLLDRTFSTELASTTLIGGQSISSTDRIESRGSIADLRLGGAFTLFPSLTVGVAGHLLTGQHRVLSERFFADTSQFGNVSDSASTDFTGLAASAGAEWRPVRGFSVAGSYRHGGTLRAKRNDTTLTSAHAPDRLGVGLRFDRITGASFTASYSTTKWTNLAGLGSSAFTISDDPEIAVGAEAIGPRLGSTLLLVRLGGRHRTLPFGIGGAKIGEMAYAGGLSMPFSGARAVFDLTVQHASRTPSGGTLGGASERAWTTSFGLTVRP